MAKFNNIEQARAYVETLPIGSIIDLCSQLLYEKESFEKIKLTQEQFEAHFRIAGIREDGTIERRGQFGRGRPKTKIE